MKGSACLLALILFSVGPPALQAQEYGKIRALNQRAAVVIKQRNDFVAQALHGMSVNVYEGCDDPVSCFDECDVYVEATPYVFFLGIPCFGGDYNEGCVSCRQSSIPALSEALCRIAEAFPLFCEKEGLPVL